MSLCYVNMGQIIFLIHLEFEVDRIPIKISDMKNIFNIIKILICYESNHCMIMEVNMSFIIENICINKGDSLIDAPLFTLILF